MYKACRCSILVFIIVRVPPVWILMNFHTLLQELLTRHRSTVAEFLSKNYSWVGPVFFCFRFTFLSLLNCVHRSKVVVHCIPISKFFFEGIYFYVLLFFWKFSLSDVSLMIFPFLVFFRIQLNASRIWKLHHQKTSHQGERDVIPYI